MSASIPQRLLLTALAGVFGTLLISPVTPALAQTSAGAQQARSINLPAQPLGAALNALSTQTGVQILASGDVVSGHSAPAVSGQLTPRQAVDRLLAGTNLVARSNDSGTLIVQAPAASPVAPSNLPDVRVRAQRSTESAFGPAQGYVATRSATGTKTDTPLVSTPQSVSVITRQELDDRNVQTLTEAIALAFPYEPPAAAAAPTIEDAFG